MCVHADAIVFGTAFLLMLQCSEEIRYHLPPATCEIQMGNERHWCIYDNNQYATGRTAVGRFTELSFNGDEGLWDEETIYSNISVGFPRGFSGAVQLVRIDEVNEYVIMQIDLNGQFFADKPFYLLLHTIPYRLHDLAVRTIKANASERDPCEDGNFSFECQSLKIDMKHKFKEKKLEFVLINGPGPTSQWNDPLKLELYHGQCYISCNEPHPPCPTNMTSFEWSNPKTEFITDKLAAAYYCARVVFSFQGHDCCALHTRTVLVQYDQAIPHTEHKFHLSQFFYYVFVFLALAILLTVFLYCRTTKRVIRSRSVPPKTGAELALKPQEEETSRGDIFLVYPRNDHQFMTLMSTFRAVLREYSGKVWDQHEDREVENVMANPAKWMQAVLMTKGIKIVLVETMEAIEWYRSDQRTVDIDDRDLYIPVLSYLHNQPHLIYDYRRVHVVRFDKIRSDSTRSLLNIVPQKRYMMPYQLGLLIRDLTNCHEDALVTESESPVLHRFYKATEDYQSPQ